MNQSIMDKMGLSMITTQITLAKKNVKESTTPSTPAAPTPTAPPIPPLAPTPATTTPNMVATCTEVARSVTNDSVAIQAAVEHVIKSIAPNDFPGMQRTEILQLLEPVLAAHREKKERGERDTAALNAAAKERTDRDKAAQTRLFARAQKNATKSNAKTTSNSGRLSADQIREQFTTLAKQITQEQSIVTAAIDRIFKLKQGRIVACMSQTVMDKMGLSIITENLKLAQETHNKHQELIKKKEKKATTPLPAAKKQPSSDRKMVAPPAPTTIRPTPVAAKTTTKSGRLSADQIREQFTTLAKQITQDQTIITAAIDLIFKLKQGGIVARMSQAIMDRM
jgi:ribosome-associated toxin RatA of RatAB toxin-antitoxin module